YDGDQPSEGAEFFGREARRASSLPSERITHLILGGHHITLGWRRQSIFPFMSRTPSAWAAGSTALLSLLLAGLVVILHSSRRRASDRLNFIQAASALGTWELDIRSGTVFCSEQ